MSDDPSYTPPSRLSPDTHQRGDAKLSRIPVRVETQSPLLPKPAWIRTRAPSGAGVGRIRRILREQGLASVCEEAACPNLGECFSHGTATFMVMGDICTRRCPFCDVAHGRPQPLDPEEPPRLARAVQAMGLGYLVITSVDRDDLRDGGGAHFAACVRETRALNPGIQVEILVPDFRGRQDIALDALAASPPDVFNHNLETVPRLYRQARPGADYGESLQLLARFKERCPGVPTKSGIMLGLGESLDEVTQVLKDLRAQGCELLTLGQYLRPSRDHLPVVRYWEPAEFDALKILGESLGFAHVASAPLVRSSYQADRQARRVLGES